jgi:hypothetical protein
VSELHIVIAAEARSDARRATLIADRVLARDLGWADAEALLPSLRRWCGETNGVSFLDIHKIHELARQQGLPPVHGHFNDGPAAHDYQQAMQALRLAIAADPAPQAVVWVRDTDGDPSRRQGWIDARTRCADDFQALVGGTPNECMEAWLLAAWSPQSPQDHEALVRQRQRLGFDPTQQPHRLSHKHDVPKSAKAVVDALGVDDGVLETCDLDALVCDDGEHGLAAFLTELRERLVPAVRHGPR